MKENEMNYLKKVLWVVIFLFAVRCMITVPQTLYEGFGHAGEAISVGLVIMTVYEKLLWKWNPLHQFTTF